ncbi:MAG: hypothetical protein L6R39_004474 [Caloplaca ligustica]|nr:MAG: hypothetical protein L6R39_004474 [Caloplaca ligustica]
MGSKEGTETSWKERLLNAWHQPWFLRVNTNDPWLNSGDRHRRRQERSALSTTKAPLTQSRCAFLSQIPGEIRNAIYLLLLGNRCLAILDTVPKDRTSRCRIRHVEWQKEVWWPGNHSAKHPRPTNKLAVLQTCRQIYTEAADILYTTNCFLMPDMNDIEAFNLFTRTISLNHLASITRLSIVCRINYFEPMNPFASTMFKRWRRMWTTISLNMPALRHLTLQLRYLYVIENLKLTTDTYWVKPFLRLRNLKTFELVVDREDMVFPGVQNPREAEEMAAKVERLRQYSTKLLCSPH